MTDVGPIQTVDAVGADCAPLARDNFLAVEYLWWVLLQIDNELLLFDEDARILDLLG